jgi:PmbA protein
MQQDDTIHTGKAAEDFSALGELILQEAGKQGATAAEAMVSSESGKNVTVRMGEVETVEFNRDKGLVVTVYIGNSKGSASTTDFRRSSVLDTVSAACSIARYTAADDCAGLPDQALMATDIPDLDLYHPWQLEMDEAIDIALRCEDAARQEDSRIVNSDGATVSSHEGCRFYTNSHGFAGSYPYTSHSISCVVIAKDDDSMERAYWYDTSRNASELDDVAAIGKRASERALAMLHPRRINTRQMPVLFSAEIASSLLGHFVSAVRGGNLYRRSSFLLDALGQQIFPTKISLQEQPHLPGAVGSAPFDNEGVATRSRYLVEQGVLQGYVLDNYSACRLGMVTTGNAGGVHNLGISQDSKDQDELIRDMGDGVLIRELMGQGINMVTGDYSRGAAGFVVENGEIKYPVSEITVAGNLASMFQNIIAVGNDTETRRNIRTGSILVDGMTVAGD